MSVFFGIFFLLTQSSLHDDLVYSIAAIIICILMGLKSISPTKTSSDNRFKASTVLFGYPTGAITSICTKLDYLSNPSFFSTMMYTILLLPPTHSYSSLSKDHYLSELCYHLPRTKLCSLLCLILKSHQVLPSYYFFPSPLLPV